MPATFARWKETHPWVKLNDDKKAICSICTKAVEKYLLISLDSFDLSAKVPWVDKGFAGWNNAKQRIEKHGQSCLQIQSVQALFNINKVNVVQHLSSATHNQ